MHEKVRREKRELQAKFEQQNHEAQKKREEEGEREIDLDYNDYVEVRIKEEEEDPAALFSQLAVAAEPPPEAAPSSPAKPSQPAESEEQELRRHMLTGNFEAAVACCMRLGLHHDRLPQPVRRRGHGSRLVRLSRLQLGRVRVGARERQKRERL